MTGEPDTQEKEVALRGVLQRGIYASPDGRFQVAELEPQPPAGAVVVAGDFRGCAVGDTVEIRGTPITHRRYGPQLRIATIQWVPPVTPEGLRRFLAGGSIPGIGATLAERIVELFGDDTLKVLDEHPERLTEVSGIGTARAAAIAAAWRTKHARAEEAAFLAGLGLGPALSRRVQRVLGLEAAQRIREDPFMLARAVEGVGFHTADKVARHLEVPPESPQRLRAALEYVLSAFGDEGHVYAERSELVRRTANLLALPRGPVEDCLEELLRQDVLVAEALPEDQAVYLPLMHAAEREVAAELRRRAGDRSAAPGRDPEAALRWIEPRLPFALTGNQRDAARLVFSQSLCILTGGPGVGKTTLVRVVAEVLEKEGQELALAAPTGRAARRLEEACNRPATTLHRLLRYQPRKQAFEHDRDRPLPVDALLIDEASMVDLLLMRDVLRALPRAARLILVGDADQLPSVGPGEVLRSLVQSGTIPTARLTRILRQREGSSIVAAAHRVLAGEVPEFQKEAGEGAFFIRRERVQDVQRTVVELVAERLPRSYGWNARRDIQVLTPMQRGPLGVIELNRLLKAALNPTGDNELGPGDRVMQTRNNYDLEVFNGEIGIVSSFDAGTGAPVVAFEDRTLAYTADAARELVLAYATTVHKSQGCEFSAVVLVLSMQHFLLLRRNLLYTAITRARSVLVLVADERALHQAIVQGDVRRRNSFLEELLARPALHPPLAQTPGNLDR